jgi:glyoxylase-like metal-dependent hydrolase (beta-lactamase superfamily II)
MKRCLALALVACGTPARERPPIVQRASVETIAPSPSRGWRVRAVEYARSKDVAASRLAVGATGTVDMSWYFFVVERGDVALLVDTGTDAFARAPKGELAARWQITRALGVVDALAQAGLSPAEVTDVALTHAHWDHAGGLAHFKHARVHAHDGEWAGQGHDHRGFATTPVQLFDGVTIVEAGRHTPHHCVVEVRCAERTVVLGGDGAYLYRNLELRLPITVTTDAAANVADMQALLAKGEVIPGHDPELFVRHPSTVPGLATICP